MERVWVISLDKQYENHVKDALKRFLGREVNVYVNERGEHYSLHCVNGEMVPDTESGPSFPIDVYADVFANEAVCFKNVDEGGDLSWIMFWQNEFSRSSEAFEAVGDYLYELKWEADRFGDERYCVEALDFPKDIDFSELLSRYEHHTEFDSFGDNPFFKAERWKTATKEYFDSYFESKAEWFFDRYCERLNIEVPPALPIDYKAMAERFKQECHRVGGHFSYQPVGASTIRQGVADVWNEIVEEYVVQNMRGIE